MTRIVAALVGLAVLLPAMIWGGTTAVEIIVPIAALLCMDEYARMAFPDDRPFATSLMTALAAAVYGSVLYLGDRYGLLACIGVVLVAMISTVLRPGPIDRAADRFGRTLTGVAWVGGTFVFMPLLRRLDGGLAWVFMLLTIAWLSDTGGYFAGRFFGKHKLYEAISPKKTVEGYVGGMALATVGVGVVRQIGLPDLSIIDVVVLGVGLGTLGVIGDLAESMLKRSFGVKDSGTLLPGHGGLLDRVDAVLFVAPALYGYAVLVKGY